MSVATIQSCSHYASTPWLASSHDKPNAEMYMNHTFSFNKDQRHVEKHDAWVQDTDEDLLWLLYMSTECTTHLGWLSSAYVAHSLALNWESKMNTAVSHLHHRNVLKREKMIETQHDDNDIVIPKQYKLKNDPYRGHDYDSDCDHDDDDFCGDTLTEYGCKTNNVDLMRVVKLFNHTYKLVKSLHTFDPGTLFVERDRLDRLAQLSQLPFFEQPDRILHPSPVASIRIFDNIDQHCLVCHISCWADGVMTINMKNTLYHSCDALMHQQDSMASLKHQHDDHHIDEISFIPPSMDKVVKSLRDYCLQVKKMKVLEQHRNNIHADLLPIYDVKLEHDRQQFKHIYAFDPHDKMLLLLVKYVDRKYVGRADTCGPIETIESMGIDHNDHIYQYQTYNFNMLSKEEKSMIYKEVYMHHPILLASIKTIMENEAVMMDACLTLSTFSNKMNDSSSNDLLESENSHHETTKDQVGLLAEKYPWRQLHARMYRHTYHPTLHLPCQDTLIFSKRHEHAYPWQFVTHTTFSRLFNDQYDINRENTCVLSVHQKVDMFTPSTDRRNVMYRYAYRDCCTIDGGDDINDNDEDGIELDDISNMLNGNKIIYCDLKTISVFGAQDVLLARSSRLTFDQKCCLNDEVVNHQTMLDFFQQQQQGWNQQNVHDTHIFFTQIVPCWLKQWMHEKSSFQVGEPLEEFEPVRINIPTLQSIFKWKSTSNYRYKIKNVDDQSVTVNVYPSNETSENDNIDMDNVSTRPSFKLGNQNWMKIKLDTSNNAKIMDGIVGHIDQTGQQLQHGPLFEFCTHLNQCYYSYNNLSNVYLNMVADVVECIVTNPRKMNALSFNGQILRQLTYVNMMHSNPNHCEMFPRVQLPTLFKLDFEHWCVQPNLIYLGPDCSSIVLMWHLPNKRIIWILDPLIQCYSLFVFYGDHKMHTPLNQLATSQVPLYRIDYWKSVPMNRHINECLHDSSSTSHLSDNSLNKNTHTKMRLNYKLGTMLKKIYLLNDAGHPLFIQTSYSPIQTDKYSLSSVPTDHTLSSLSVPVHTTILDEYIFTGSLWFTGFGIGDVDDDRQETEMVHLTKKKQDGNNNATKPPQLLSQVSYNRDAQVNHIQHIKNNYKNISVAAKDVYNPNGYLGFKITRTATDKPTITVLKITPDAYVAHGIQHQNKYRANTAVVLANYTVEKLSHTKMKDEWERLETIMRQQFAPHLNSDIHRMDQLKSSMHRCPSCSRQLCTSDDDNDDDDKPELIQLLPCKHLLCTQCLLESSSIMQVELNVQSSSYKPSSSKPSSSKPSSSKLSSSKPSKTSKSSSKSIFKIFSSSSKSSKTIPTSPSSSSPKDAPLPLKCIYCQQGVSSTPRVSSTQGTWHELEVIEQGILRLTPIALAYTSVHIDCREFKYPLHERIVISNFDPDLTFPCAPGIHFFMHLKYVVDFLSVVNIPMVAIESLSAVAGAVPSSSSVEVTQSSNKPLKKTVHDKRHKKIAAIASSSGEPLSNHNNITYPPTNQLQQAETMNSSEHNLQDMNTLLDSQSASLAITDPMALSTDGMIIKSDDMQHTPSISFLYPRVDEWLSNHEEILNHASLSSIENLQTHYDGEDAPPTYQECQHLEQYRYIERMLIDDSARITPNPMHGDMETTSLIHFDQIIPSAHVDNKKTYTNIDADSSKIDLSPVVDDDSRGMDPTPHSSTPLLNPPINHPTLLINTTELLPSLIEKNEMNSKMDGTNTSKLLPPTAATSSDRLLAELNHLPAPSHVLRPKEKDHKDASSSLLALEQLKVPTHPLYHASSSKTATFESPPSM